MTSDRHKACSAEQIFDQYLQSTHRRRTQERMMVLACAEKMKGHFTTEDVARQLQADHNNVALATVYSTLDLLTHCGILTARYFDTGVTYYEKASTPHMHLVCTSCGKIRDLRDTNIDAIVADRRFSSFTPTRYAMTVYGLCGACAKADKTKNKSNTTISKSQKRK